MRLALLLRRLRDPVGAKGQPPAPVSVRTVGGQMRHRDRHMNRLPFGPSAETYATGVARGPSSRALATPHERDAENHDKGSP